MEIKKTKKKPMNQRYYSYQNQQIFPEAALVHIVAVGMTVLDVALVAKMILQTAAAVPVKQNHPYLLASCFAFGFLHLPAKVHLVFLVATAKGAAYCLPVVNFLHMVVVAAAVVVVAGMFVVASGHTG